MSVPGHSSDMLSPQSSGGFGSDAQFSQTEQHLIGIIKSLQAALLESQKELSEYKNTVIRCRRQLEDVHNLLRMAIENDTAFYHVLDHFSRENAQTSTSSPEATESPMRQDSV